MVNMNAALQWKEEPESPLNYEEVELLDDTFYHTPLDEILEDVKLEDYELDGCETKAEVASQILENLENLMDLDDLIKQEPFFLDEKMLPLLDDIQPPCSAVAVPVNFKTERYYDHMAYDIVELNPNTTAALTPPQTPPRDTMITNLDLLNNSNHRHDVFIQQHRRELEKPAVYSVPDKQFASLGQPHTGLVNIYAPVSTIPNYNFVTIPTPQHDVAHELAVVDELVRTRVEDMQWNSSGPSSPESSSNSNFGDCSSSEDPEWIPEPLETCGNVLSNQANKMLKKKRSKLFKDPEDKKSRKKEQNKNAATRYRMKKKAEVEEILNEEKIILGVNSELNTKITDLQREIKYLKSLMRDLLKAKAP